MLANRVTAKYSTLTLPPCVWAPPLSRVWLSATPWTVAHQAPLSMGWIFQARMLEWVAISFSRGSSQPKDRTRVFCPGRWILYHWASYMYVYTYMTRHTNTHIHTYVCVYDTCVCIYVCIYVWQMIKLCYFSWVFRSKSELLFWRSLFIGLYHFYGSKECTPCGGDVEFLYTRCMGSLYSWQLWPSFLSWTSSCPNLLGATVNKTDILSPGWRAGAIIKARQIKLTLSL